MFYLFVSIGMRFTHGSLFGPDNPEVANYMSAILGSNNNHAGNDWKRKYLAEKQEYDRKRQQWQEDESQLIRDILRLAFSYIGINADLDRLLARLRYSLKNNSSGKERRQLIKNIIADIITQVDSVKGGKNSTKDMAESLAELLQGLSLTGTSQQQVTSLVSQLRQNASEQNIHAGLKFLLAEFKQNNPSDDAINNPESVQQVNSLTRLLGELQSQKRFNGELTGLAAQARSISTQQQELSLIKDIAKLISNLVNETNGHETLAVMLELLDKTSFPEDFREQKSDLRQKLAAIQGSESFDSLLDEFSNLITMVNIKLQNELDEIQIYLTNLLEQLEELGKQITDSSDLNPSSYEDAISLNSQISDDMSKLSSAVGNSNSIDEIKSSLDSHLSEINAHLETFVETERIKQLKSNMKITELSQKIQHMESETVELKSAVERERLKSQIDSLTGISNRLAYEEILEHEYSRWQRHQNNLTLALIDIDNFKHINDEYGHLAGDKVLKTVAGLCKKHTRVIDFLARYGGEEFVMLLPDTGIEDALSAAEHIRNKIEKTNFNYDDKRVQVTVSIGLSQFAGDDAPEDVFKRADNALYRAKSTGRNQTIVFGEKDAA